MIIGDLTKLRALTKSDLPKVTEWRNDPEVKALLGGWSLPVSLEETESWLERTSQENSSTFRLAIERLDTHEYIGNIGLYHIDWKNRKAECGLWIGDKSAWGKGFGTDATKTLLNLAFNDLNFHRISLQVLAHHHAAIHLYEKAGFSVEGRLREDNFKQGTYCDTLIMAILASDFHQRCQNT